MLRDLLDDSNVITSATHELPPSRDPGYEEWLDLHEPKITDEDLEQMYREWKAEDDAMKLFHKRDGERRRADEIMSLIGVCESLQLTA